MERVLLLDTPIKIDYISPDRKEVFLNLKAFVGIGIYAEFLPGLQIDVHDGFAGFVFIDHKGLHPESIQREMFAVRRFAVDVIDVFY